VFAPPNIHLPVLIPHPMKSMRPIRLLSALAAVFVAVPVTVHAESGPIYMCVDEYGRRSFTNVKAEMKGRKCERQVESAIPLTPVPHAAGKSPGTASPADFPKVDAGTQKSRDDVRRKVLSDELASEQKQLAQANQDLTVARTTKPGEDRSSPKYLERVNEAEQAMQRHRQNVESLQREIGNLK
jgi:hypothetical protein